ncbi:MAG: Class II abasic (AP) endonuclease [Claussenomyces sp. TS43310]|nr:MAG: Class II abasic (AP) endonuclease [Claussenomyces sp. TS43310]
MFDILQADIVVMQEAKIQRKDLRDDMVLVPGWDVYFSLPKYKKGYSGVAIYTRNAVCAPIRAEEGITGILTPPNSSTSFCALPIDQQIGGYPSIGQAAGPLDATTLDSEGRCVILEFPAFVLIGVYSPANRDEARDDFRLGFLNALDARVRNLTAIGKRVFLTGDLNIIREEIDTANAEEQLRKHGMTGEAYVSTPARRILNQLVADGKVIGDRDDGREQPILWDICRVFHPERKGMFTCWEQKINARPGNFGSRIDYVLCSLDLKDWFQESNIQEGLLGSDHCPVYAVITDKVNIDGVAIDIRDIMNPTGVFQDGIRRREWSPKDLLPMSAKLIPEFDRRRSIREMFSKKKSLPDRNSSSSRRSREEGEQGEESSCLKLDLIISGTAGGDDKCQTQSPNSHNAALREDTDRAPPTCNGNGQTLMGKSLNKRAADAPVVPRLPKRSKLSTTRSMSNKNVKGQSNLMRFLEPKHPVSIIGDSPKEAYPDASCETRNSESISSLLNPEDNPGDKQVSSLGSTTQSRLPTPSSNGIRPYSSRSDSTSRSSNADDQKQIVDPIATKESWDKLLSKRVVPRCEHNEPCISYLTKKPGINCGRSFYMCSRPLGPSGIKERGTEWRCGTFVWSSDWTGNGST